METLEPEDDESASYVSVKAFVGEEHVGLLFCYDADYWLLVALNILNEEFSP